jgi:hypothetical protein
MSSVLVFAILGMSPESPSNSPPEKISSFSQTENPHDVPYLVTSPIPPIFGSQLFSKAPRINFLSRSHPDLASICWVQPDENFTDETEEALNEHYDNQVKQFYFALC